MPYLLSLVVAMFVIGSQADFRMISPTPIQFPSTEAQFGKSFIGGSITGQLWYGTPGDLDGCSPLVPDGQASPWSASVSQGIAAIVMVDRGNNCTFVQKVRNGQNAAATAVVVTDNIAEGGLALMTDDGTGYTITIPSIFISQASGNALKTELANNKTVIVQLSWDAPTNYVEMDYWMTANDDSESFKRDFRQVSEALGNRLLFQAHYLFINGVFFGCNLPSLPCGNQCKNNGRYCAQDPEHDLDTGKTGAMVVEENVRQYCIFQNANATNTIDLYFNYITRFYDYCDPSATTFNVDCSETQQTNSGINVQATRDCVTRCGALYDGATDGTNTCIESELANAQDYGVHVLPSVYIAGRQYSAPLDCSHPVSLSTCDPLATLCTYYASGQKPDACLANYCWSLPLDCFGVCGGTGIKDDCGVCQEASNKNTTVWNSHCKGCDGVLNGKTLDTCGKCGGSGSYDDCGRCLQANDPLRTDGSCAADVAAVTSASHVIVGVVVAVVFLVVGGIGGFLYLQRAEKRMRDQMGDYLQKYVPIEAANEFLEGEKKNQWSKMNM